MRRTCFAMLSAALMSATGFVTSTSIAEVSLPKMLSSHMVLQRDRPLHLWGDGTPGETVAVTFHGSSGTATADELGRWSVFLPAEHAGGPYTLTVRGTNTIELADILVGDLWFASGQSNMEMPLKGFDNGKSPIKGGEQAIREADRPEMRLLMVTRGGAPYPLEDLAESAAWTRCTPETAKDFSAVAYFFGRSLEQHEKVPIGLIDSTWGGTPAEAWTSLQALGSDAGLMPVFAARAEMTSKEAAVVRRDALDARAKARGLTPQPRDWHPGLLSWEPAALYNAMVAPFTPLPIRGVIWYQGESNSGAGRAPLYDKLFPAMIEDWRRQWGEEQMPFLFVQLASFAASPKDDWPTIREAQRRTLALRNTGMAVAVDVGDAGNIHPADKQTVGERLALLARSISYGEAVDSSGPEFQGAIPLPAKGAIEVRFDHARGLVARDGGPKGLEIAGGDRVFVPATGTIEGETLVVSSPEVKSPMYVRYAWRSYPEANLYNKAGLPASPFTSLAPASKP